MYIIRSNSLLFVRAIILNNVTGVGHNGALGLYRELLHDALCIVELLYIISYIASFPLSSLIYAMFHAHVNYNKDNKIIIIISNTVKYFYMERWVDLCVYFIYLISCLSSHI